MNDLLLTLHNPIPQKSTDRKSYGMSLAQTWIPACTAINVLSGYNAIDPAVLGYPIRYATDKDGSLKFSSKGNVQMKVAPELGKEIRTIMQNFEAQVRQDTAKTFETHKDETALQIEQIQKQGAEVAKWEKLVFESGIAKLKVQNSMEKAMSEAVRKSAKSEKVTV